jgi:hypothetical protein
MRVARSPVLAAPSCLGVDKHEYEYEYEPDVKQHATLIGRHGPLIDSA